MHQQICPECQGERLKPYPAAAELHGNHISQLSSMTIAECSGFLQKSYNLTKQEYLIARRTPERNPGAAEISDRSGTALS